MTNTAVAGSVNQKGRDEMSDDNAKIAKEIIRKASDLGAYEEVHLQDEENEPCYGDYLKLESELTSILDAKDTLLADLRRERDVWKKEAKLNLDRTGELAEQLEEARRERDEAQFKLAKVEVSADSSSYLASFPAIDKLEQSLATCRELIKEVSDLNKSGITVLQINPNWVKKYTDALLRTPKTRWERLLEAARKLRNHLFLNGVEQQDEHYLKELGDVLALFGSGEAFGGEK